MYVSNLGIDSQASSKSLGSHFFQTWTKDNNMNNTEVFKDIPGYEGLYQVSNLGNVKSLSREMYNGKVNFTSKEKILKSNIGKRGYKCLNLVKNGKLKNITIHKLVAMAFLAHNPDGFKIVVDHINNDKLDNRVENLQLISNRENCSKDSRSIYSKYVGVTFHKKRNKWMAQIRVNSKSVYLGYFDTELEAHEAYQKALAEINC